jgi:tetratricopeptide (TPR) repeat protein/SAM-dependent methyltransferase
MNRKERRAAQRQAQRGAPAPPLPAAQATADPLAVAVQHLRAGRLREAEHLCRDALRRDPQSFAALHLLGFIAFQSGHDQAAIELMTRAVAVDPHSTECHFHLALALHRSGRLDEAAAHFSKAAALKPDFAAAHLDLGNVLMQQGKPEAAKDSYRRALALDAGSADTHLNLGNAFMRLDQPAAAEGHYRRASELKPDHVGAYLNLGAALIAQARLPAAIESLRRAAALKPEAAEIHRHLADALHHQGQPGEALASYRRALSLQPNALEARHGLGNVLMELGEFRQAVEEYRRVLVVRPEHAEICNNLGIALAALGQYAEAEAQYRRALALKPGLVDVHRNLGRVVLARGGPEEALWLARRGLAIEETVEGRAFFVECAKNLPVDRADGELRNLLARALTEGWSRPGELSGLAGDLFQASEAGKICLARMTQPLSAVCPAPEVLDRDTLALLAADRLLLALMESAPVRQVALERLLALARRTLLDWALDAAAGDLDPPLLAFFCALAIQCFINEYVFAHDSEEWAGFVKLREALDHALSGGAAIPPLWLVAAAAYGPLHELGQAAALLQAAWPDPIKRLLRQQIEEPLTERKIRAGIPTLTGVDDAVSQKVRQQYEDMPYPRWITAAPVGRPAAIEWHLRNRFPLAPIRHVPRRERLDMLIAGCGTGQHSIESAQRYAGAQVLAIDLSLTSLGYAARKTRSLGLSNIEYGQADILRLGALGRSFDVIEASGVLHHLRDPAEGWRILLRWLRPGGFMSVGLYSAIARADVRAARAFIAEGGYGQSAADIRRCRQDIMALADGTEVKNVASYPDFFSISECRDLLFHVEEHQLTIPQIAAFLAENGLVFIGFATDAERKYRQRFPDDPSMTNLDNWHRFETEMPSAFAGMYQFWVQKP